MALCHPGMGTRSVEMDTPHPCIQFAVMANLVELGNEVAGSETIYGF